MAKKRKITMYMADFETTVYDGQTSTEVWAANIVMKDWFRGMLKLFGKEKKI